MEQAVPQRIREVISERLRRLDRDTDRALGVAAVLGRRFAAAEVAALLGELDQNRLLDLLDGAVEAGFVDAIPGAGQEYRFRHELLRQCLYDEHGSARRSALHRDMGRRLLQQGRNVSDDEIFLLAHHLYEAGPSGDLDQAVAACFDAGIRADALYAFAEAAGHYARAIELLDLQPDLDSTRRAELLLAQGRARYASGDVASARSALFSACVGAARVEAWTVVARAVVTFTSVGLLSGGPHRICIPLHEQCLELLDDEWPEKVVVRSSLAKLLHAVGRRAEATPLLERCMQEIDRIQSPEIKHQVLINLGAVLEKTAPDQASELFWKGYTEAERLGDEVQQLDLLSNVLCAAPLQGDIDAIRKVLPEFARLSDAINHFHYRYICAGGFTVLALLEGRWRDALAATRSQYELGIESDAPGVNGVHAYQMFVLHWMLGKLDAVRPLIKGMAAETDGLWAPGYGLIAAELDLRDDAAAALARVARDDYALVVNQGEQGIVLALLAEVCVYLRDKAEAERLIELLRPHAEQAMGFHHSVILGSGAHFLGKLLMLMGDRDQGMAWLQQGLALHERMGARPWTAFSQLEIAKAMLSARRPDQVGAMELLAAAEATANELEMVRLAAQIEALLLPLREGAERLSNRELDVLRLIEGGATNKHIANTLHVSETTVATHVRNILRKTEASNRVEAVANARRLDWLQDDGG